MKKLLFLLLDLLSFSAVGGAYAVYDFSRRKLGMQRWVNYQTMRMQKLLPLELIKAAACIFVLLCLLALLIAFLKGRRQKRLFTAADRIMLLFSAVYGAAFLFFTVFVSVSQLSSYYFILLLTGIGFLCTGVRNFLAIRRL